MILKDSLYILLRRISPETVMNNWIDTVKGSSQREPLCLIPDEDIFYTTLQTQFNHYSVDESEYVLKYIKECRLSSLGINHDYGIFGLIAYAVEDIFTTDSRNECMCKYKYLLKFRDLSHPIDPLLFVCAFLAQKDIDTGYKRQVFSWNPIVRTNNTRLHHILNHGMAENHFHIGGSVNAFMFSWICLMNHYSADRKSEFQGKSIDSYPLDTFYLGTAKTNESNYSLTLKAACIRYFLYLRMNDQWPTEIGDYADDKEAFRRSNDWLCKMLSMSEEECDQYADQLDKSFSALRSLCISAGNDGFIPDYAMMDEPMPPLDNGDNNNLFNSAIRNYERRLYRPLSGEQRFLYSLFRAVFTKDSRIVPYLDLAYSYILIYCRIRGELMQANNRVGFRNFQKYQDRKEIFTKKWPDYENLRLSVAFQDVLSNPQICSLEGRFRPSESSEDLIKYVKYFCHLASTPFYDDEKLKEQTKQAADSKLHFVLHFIKQSQFVSDAEYEELVSPRDHKLRSIVEKQATAIIEARETDPNTMSKVTGIDAASSEIDCRPEVFATQFRRIRKQKYGFDSFINTYPQACLRITYHAGEDFLDPVDGLRAINEAISFCEMAGGDRLGHALALGIDCEEWYAQKNYLILMQKQVLLDNFAWLYGKMHQYNIHSSEAESHINKWFKKLFTDIYTSNAETDSILRSVDVSDYYASLSLRGNDPYVYFHNAEGSPEERKAFEDALMSTEETPWKIRKKAGINFDHMSNVLYHYYHFDYRMKKTSSQIIEYSVPKCIVDVVCDLQEKFRYDISKQNIGIECNPSSNFLIGTFKNYLKHPIFRFNNNGLYAPSHPNYSKPNPRILTSINTDDLGVFDTSLENEFALVACALEIHNEYCDKENIILPDNIYSWLDNIRQSGCDQSFIKIPIE